MCVCVYRVLTMGPNCHTHTHVQRVVSTPCDYTHSYVVAAVSLAYTTRCFVPLKSTLL